MTHGVKDVLISSEQLLDKLGHEELNLKRQGLVNQAAGMRSAIVAIIKAVHEAKRGGQAPEPSLEPSS